MIILRWGLSDRWAEWAELSEPSRPTRPNGSNHQRYPERKPILCFVFGPCGGPGEL
jgi:hypothetical protein